MRIVLYKNYHAQLSFTVHQYLQMSVEYEHVLRKKLLLGWSKTAYGYAKGCF